MTYKVAAYLRLSKEEYSNEKESNSITNQKLIIDNYLKEHREYKLVDYYIDDGISGKSLKERPEVLRLIQDVRTGRVKNVLVYKLDRLTRSVKDLIYLIELFSDNNCTFNSQTEKIDTSNAVGRMFVKIIGIFAEFERENLAERVSLGYEQKTREGNYTNCNGVYGYDYVLGVGLRVNGEESGVVKDIYRWYLKGNSMLAISKMLQERDIPTKRGGVWRQSTIKSILTGNVISNPASPDTFHSVIIYLSRSTTFISLVASIKSSCIVSAPLWYVLEILYVNVCVCSLLVSTVFNIVTVYP